MRAAALTLGATLVILSGTVRAGPPLDPSAVARPVASAMSEARDRYGVAPSADLLLALIHVESRFDPAARSKRGALGLMQVMPLHVRRYDFLREAGDLMDPRLNVLAGTLFLTEQLLRHDSMQAALRAYHGGPGAATSPYPSTRRYERLVMQRLKEIHNGIDQRQ